MRLFRTAALAVFLILLTSFVHAQNSDAPPPVPTGDYKITFYLTDSQGAKIPDSQAYFTFTNEKGTSVQAASPVRSGIAYAYLDRGDWEGIVEVDDPLTPAYDYALAFNTSVSSDANTTLSLYEISSTNLRIHDEAGLLVPSVSVSLDCVRVPPSEKNKFPKDALSATSSPEGTLLLRHVPIGNCYIYAAKDNRVGMISVNSSRGEIVERTAVLKDKVKDDMLSSLPFFVVLIAALIIMYFIFVKKKGDENGEAPQHGKPIRSEGTASHEEKARTAKPHEEGKQIPDKPSSVSAEKLSGILNTLDAREKKIVELVRKNGGQMKQSKIYHTLLYPKASLSRMLRSLERKNIITLEPFGNSKSVRLSDWLQK
ncbi:Uncharacterised protein [Candidatus Anstonella stagnisolia]|nr:Uncharacterised protein [Candidatus Anstonella stagnisolia]